MLNRFDSQWTVVVLFFLLVGGQGCQQDTNDSQPSQPPVLRLYNWLDYTPIEVLEGFTKKTGIKVALTEFSSVDQSLAEVQMNPDRFDLICVGELSAPFFKGSRLIGPLDHSRLPHLDNLQPWLKDYVDLEYLVPYMVGSTGIAVNTDHISEASTAWGMLWDPALRGKIALLGDVREVVAILLAACGKSINSTSTEDLECAAQRGLSIKQNEITWGDAFSNAEQFVSGEKWVAQVYNGVLYELCPKDFPMRYFFPEQGGSFWVDGLAVTRNAPNPDAAYLFLDYLLTLSVGAQLSNQLFFRSPLKGIESLINPDLLNSPLVYFPMEQWSKHEILHEQGEAYDEYQRIYAMVMNPQD